MGLKTVVVDCYAETEGLNIHGRETSPVDVTHTKIFQDWGEGAA